MNHSLSVVLLLIASFLAGCVAQPGPELRPYTAEETRQLAMEGLNRRGLSFDEYQQKKAELAGRLQKPFGFDRQGEMNAERNVMLHDRPS
ncbi:hypothetical protein HBO12_17970 [Pseudomonas sp. WS 5059]|uniref:hypothetical protein n=1 Tax=Pseudomonas sp. WS 5059 TaxID=2717491 RepID=UPI001475E19D|nr:hypothetical protein [Pseudomonas sp. WS 5059]NMY04852.1 hypothetical protein [Pseudomonas sp. WS 5059]